MGAPATLDFQQIGRILDAVKLAGGTVPCEFYAETGISELDPFASARRCRADLAAGISWAYTIERILPDMESDARAKRRFKAIGDVARKSRQLASLLRDEDLGIAHWLMGHFDPSKRESSSSTLAGLDALTRAAVSEARRLKAEELHTQAPFAHIEASSDPKNKTARDVFLQQMRDAYEEHLRQPARIVYTDRHPTGPFVSFLQAVTKEMGEPPMKGGALQQALYRAGLGNKAADKG